MNNARERLIIALDDLTRDEALALVQKTRAYASTYKVGLSLFSAYGPSLVQDIQSLGAHVFLDLKFHDIPMQVLKAVERCLALNPRFLTLHASGGLAMLSQCAKLAQATKTTLLAVTVLTSIDDSEAHRLGFNESIKDKVLRLAGLALEAGLGALVCSPQEAAILKAQFGSSVFLVCPGVRSAKDELSDQARVMSAGDALRAGADCLVVGRPLTKARDIETTAQSYGAEIEGALVRRGEQHAI